MGLPCRALQRRPARGAGCERDRAKTAATRLAEEESYHRSVILSPSSPARRPSPASPLGPRAIPPRLGLGSQAPFGMLRALARGGVCRRHPRAHLETL